MQCIHGGGDNSAHQNALLIQFRVTLISRTYGPKLSFTAFCKTQPAHREYPALHDRYTLQCCRASGICRYRTEKDGMPDVVGEYAWLHHGDDFHSGIPLKTEDKSENRYDVVVTVTG